MRFPLRTSSLLRDLAVLDQLAIQIASSKTRSDHGRHAKDDCQSHCRFNLGSIRLQMRRIDGGATRLVNSSQVPCLQTPQTRRAGTGMLRVRQLPHALQMNTTWLIRMCQLGCPKRQLRARQSFGFCQMSRCVSDPHRILCPSFLVHSPDPRDGHEAVADLRRLDSHLPLSTLVLCSFFVPEHDEAN